MADMDAEEFAQAVAAASDADQELERLRAENAELRDDAERWAHIAGIARGVLKRIVGQIPVTDPLYDWVKQTVDEAEQQIQQEPAKAPGAAPPADARLLLIADTLTRHRTVEVPIRLRWRTVGYRHDCLCGWQSEMYRRRDRRTRAVSLSAATNHAAKQITEALVAAVEAETQIQGGECSG